MNAMQSWRRALGAGVLALSVVAADAAWADEPVRGGSITVGLETDLRGFDPIKGRVLGNSAATVINVIEERLFDFDPDGGLIPVLATGMESENGGMSWLVHLREGVTFHDGTPFDADAVVAHWARILSPVYIGGLFLRPMESVEKVDSHTVRFHLKHPWAPFAGAITLPIGFAPYIPSPTAVTAETHHRQPVGTGPYMFKEWSSGDRLVVVRNPNYWRDGPPYLDEITFRFLPDQQTRLASLQSGDIDVMWMDRGTTIRSAQKDDELVAHEAIGGGSLIIFMFNASKPPLDNPLVRRALSHAWNQPVALRVMYRDTQSAITHPYGAALDCGAAGYREHDIAAAKALLAEFGEPVELEMIHTTTPRGREAGQMLQQFFKRVGVTLNLKPVDQLQLRQRVFTNNYQISGWRIGDSGDQGPQLFGLFRKGSPYNIMKYNTPEMDALLDAQRETVDPAARAKLMCEIAEKINQDAPIVYAGGRRHYAFSRPRLKGIPPLTNGVIRLGDVWVTDGE